MGKKLSKDEFKEVLFTVFNIYSHFSDKETLSKAVDNIEGSIFQQLNEKQDLNKLFYVLNQHINRKDIVRKLREIESYSNIMGLSLLWD